MSLIDSAERLYEKGDYSGSLEIVLKFLENEPNDVKALELKAVLLYIQNLLPESIRTYKRLLRFYGGNDEVWKQLSALRSISNAFRLLRSYDNAIIYCEKSIAICEHFLNLFT